MLKIMPINSITHVWDYGGVTDYKKKGFASLDSLRSLRPKFSLSRLKLAKEAAFCAGVAGWPSGVHLQQQGVAVAVHADFGDALNVARGAALVPKFLTAAAPKVGFARLPRQRQRLGVHPGDHEDFAGGVVLENGRNQPLLIKFQIMYRHTVYRPPITVSLESLAVPDNLLLQQW